MKISKQLLKEIIREEYTCVLIEQAIREGMVRDVIQEAIFNFIWAYRAADSDDKTEGAEKSYILAKIAIDLFNKIMRDIQSRPEQIKEPLKFQTTKHNIKYEIDGLENFAPFPVFGQKVLEALRALYGWADEYSMPGRKESSKLSNKFNMALNLAAKNFGRRGFGQMRLTNDDSALQGVTQAIAME